MDYPAVFVSTLFHSGTNAHFRIKPPTTFELKAGEKLIITITDLLPSTATVGLKASSSFSVGVNTKDGGLPFASCR